MPSAPNLNPPASSVAVHAAIFRHPMWALTPQRGGNPDPERGSEQVKCVSARAAAEFHGAFDRGLALELTPEPGERIGVMVEDLGTVEAITAAGGERHAPEWMRAMAEKFFWQRGEDDAKTVSGKPIDEIQCGVANDEERDRAEAEHLTRRTASAGVSQSERDWGWCWEALRSGLHPAIVRARLERAPGRRCTQPRILRPAHPRGRGRIAPAGDASPGERTLMAGEERGRAEGKQWLSIT